MGTRTKRQDNEEAAEEFCFTCKDSGDDLRVCDFKNCLKVYHPRCVGKEDGFLTSGEQFICGSHICVDCRRSSDYQCLCCPLYSVCHACLGKVEFVQLRKQNKGFCSTCLNRVILIEKNAAADPDVVDTDHIDAGTSEILFKDYWEVIKDKEHLTLVDLEEISVYLNRRINCKEGVNSEKNSDDGHKSDENILADNNTKDQTIPFGSKGKQNKVNTSQKNKSNKKTYVGWGSTQLIEFLSSFGKDTAKPLDELEIIGVVKGYIKEKNLYKDDKKLCFLCDDKLQPLFTRRKVKCKNIPRFLAVHLASNAVSEDEISYGFEDDDTPVMKKKPRNSQQPKIAKRVPEQSKRCFASLVPNNIRLIYLRRTLVVSLLSQPDTFEQKVVGCFVRCKIAYRVQFYKDSTKAFMLGRVTGIKKSSEVYKINDTHTNILLCVAGLWDDVNISMLSDEDFEEDECNDLISLVKERLLERATVSEFEEKVAAVHTDIVNHWIERELVRLERNIDRANMKGLHVEFEKLMDQKKLLSTPAERQRRLEEVPEIIPDTEYEEKETELGVAASNSSRGNRAREACFSGVTLDPALQSQMHDTQVNADDNSTQAMDVDQEENDHSSQVAMTVEVINLESDEDEDLPMVQEKPEGKVMHPPRAMNARSESASPATLHAQGGMNGVVLPEPAPPTMNGVPQSEQLQPAPATMSGVVSPAQHEPALAPMNVALHLEQRRPEPVRAAENRVSPQALLWHYTDPQGDARGPFTLLHLLLWKRKGFFSKDFRVWRTGQAAEQAILLDDAFKMLL
ncbi:zinc finger CCCH domain-containing protein 44-like isoform X4 [Panicum virgatum]|uniref:zinc finger CCCH domain-containing protein 44-like isoform X4 n=1 Tax=Panicum virgatum TaxID=38727 RepID=UPI0019D638EB|nr:zinc finger CCCH domain-containing protein 44-like isoform X4 [Panicum virgatum]